MKQVTPLCASFSVGHDQPPTLQVVKIYFSEKEMPETEAVAFFQHYATKGWRSQKGNPIHWKQAAFRWRAQLFEARPWLFNRKI